MICDRFRHCSALFSGLKSLLHNGCSWCICIVISYCSIKVIENIQNYISEDTGLKEMFSLQNGCAYPLGLCKMGVRAPMVSIFMFMFFSFSRKAVAEHWWWWCELSPMICKCFYTFRCPAFGLKSLHNGCALCMCCFCIVIDYCSSKIIKYWWGSSKHMIFKKETVFFTKWVCMGYIMPWKGCNTTV